jgi:hypothetical protein
MSDHYLRLVPVDPDWRPTPEAAEAAAGLLARLFPDAYDCCVDFTEGVAFFDAGANAESISCPSCHADLDGWWDQAMGVAYETGFRELSVETPCCRARTSLNDLAYVWPAAFGSFALEVSNPGVQFITDEQRLALETALGSPLKVVWQRL